MLQLPSNIRLIRLLAGKTQEEFGRMMGANKARQFTYEKGIAEPDELYLSRISAFAGITESDLRSAKLSESNIFIKDPETKETDMEFALMPITNGQGVSELQAQLKEMELKVAQLEAQNNLLKEINDKLINANR